jgi:putative DNA methylase
MLSTKPGIEASIEPVIDNSSYQFTVKVGKPKDAEAAKNGTKLSRGANFRCVMSGAGINDPYIKAESMTGRMGSRLMAILAEGDRGRVYLAPTQEHVMPALDSRLLKITEPRISNPESIATRNEISAMPAIFICWHLRPGRIF